MNADFWKKYSFPISITVILVLVGGYIFVKKSFEFRGIKPLIPSSGVRVNEFSLSGAIERIDYEAKKIYISASIIYETSEGNMALKEERTVLVDEKTQIKKYVPTKWQSGAPPPSYPKTINISIGINSLKTGDKITVISSENLFLQKEFLAMKIQVLPK